ncbi:hypothetical protein TNCV_1973191 [Trichonephila clavipes]|nr:hypothetical protein TNCV_1973191 [Trichonephila clavipes]
MPQAEVARNLNIARMVIYRLWKQFQVTDIVVRRPGSNVTAKKLAQNFAAATGETISRETAYRHLPEKTLYARRVMVCVSLNPSQKTLVFYGAKDMCLGKIKS